MVLPAIAPARVTDFGGGIITPGFIDCHTHLVFGGDRSGEFEQRLNGVSYADIAAAGGGILATVNATRLADHDSLFASALARLRPLLAEGVTTLEIKSGYGLEQEAELRMLRAARALGRRCRRGVHRGAAGVPRRGPGAVHQQQLPGRPA